MIDDKQLEEAAKNYADGFRYTPEEKGWFESKVDDFKAGEKHILSLQEDKVDKAIGWCDEKSKYCFKKIGINHIYSEWYRGKKDGFEEVKLYLQSLKQQP